MKAILKKNPELDFFIGLIGGLKIPTKQDKFKPINGVQKLLLETGEEIPITDMDLYQKKKSENLLKAFEEEFIKHIKDNLTEEHPYNIDIKLEIVISISMDEKRLKEVDIDNLSKAVIDCFRGLLFIDDSQIQNLLAKKNVNAYKPLNGLMVGVRKINGEDDSWFNERKLAYFEYENNT